MNRFTRYGFVMVTFAAAAVTNQDILAAPIDVELAAGIVQPNLGCTEVDGRFCDLRTYQVMVEAYVDGDPTRGYGVGFGPSHHNGDLRGVTASLDHIAGLGHNAIWLTPVFDSRSGEPQQRLDGGEVVDRRLDATGYFTRDYFSIDPNFGTMDDARQLVDAAHERGLYVFFDGVFGHHKGGLAPSPSGQLPIDSTDPSDYFGNPVGYPGRVVDYDAPETLDFYKEVATYWIDELGIDGWRLDQTQQVPIQAWSEIQGAVRETSDRRVAAGEEWGTLGYMVGERFGNSSQIGAEAFGSESQPGLDSAFDFPLRYVAVQVLAVEESGFGGREASAINADFAYGSHYGPEGASTGTYRSLALPNLMIGNHDLVRFGDLLQRGGIANPEDSEYWDRHRLAFLLQTSYSGPITRYYGEEVGDQLDGFAEMVSGDCAAIGQCDDHVGRTSGIVPGVTVSEAELSDEQRALLNDLRTLMGLREAYRSLSHGSRQHLYSDDSVYLDLKTLGDEQIIFAMNVSDQEVTLRLDEALFASISAAPVDLLTGNATDLTDGGLLLTLAPLSGQLVLVSVPEPLSVTIFVYCIAVISVRGRVDTMRR